MSPQCSDTSHEGLLAALQSSIVDLERENGRLRSALAESQLAQAKLLTDVDMLQAERDEARRQWESWKILANRANERAEAAEARVRELEAGVAATINMNERETLQWWAAQSNDHLAKLRTSEARCARLEGERDESNAIIRHIAERGLWECEGHCTTSQPYLSIHCRTCGMRYERDALAQQLQRVREALEGVLGNSLMMGDEHDWTTCDNWSCKKAREALAALPPKAS